MTTPEEEEDDDAPEEEDAASEEDGPPVDDDDDEAVVPPLDPAPVVHAHQHTAASTVVWTRTRTPFEDGGALQSTAL